MNRRYQSDWWSPTCSVVHRIGDWDIVHDTDPPKYHSEKVWCIKSSFDARPPHSPFLPKDVSEWCQAYLNLIS